MPSKNTRKSYVPSSFYHIYNRGINRHDIFPADDDVYFLYSLFSRYLDPKDHQVDFDKIPFTKYNENVEINSYCIMRNHFHLLVWIGENTRDLSKAMQSIWTSYTRYFNKKYDRLGPLFQDRYKASLITDDEHLSHIISYIHLNPSNHLTYPHSSLRTFLDPNAPQLGWHSPQRVIGHFRATIDQLALDRPDLHLLEGQAS